MKSNTSGRVRSLLLYVQLPSVFPSFIPCGSGKN